MMAMINAWNNNINQYWSIVGDFIQSWGNLRVLGHVNVLKFKLHAFLSAKYLGQGISRLLDSFFFQNVETYDCHLFDM
jgi:hypothetical protein